MAGLWEGWLIEGLLWRCDEFVKERREVRVLREYGVPSWSWASVDCKVISDSHSTFGEFESLVEVVGDGMVEREGNAFVGCNRLKAVVKRRVLRLEDVLNQVTMGRMDTSRLYRVFPDIFDQTVDLSGLPGPSGDECDGSSEGRKLNNLTMLLPLIQIEHYDAVMGLLMNPSSRGGNMFCRVGSFQAWFKDKEQLWEAFGSPNKVETEALSCVYLI